MGARASCCRCASRTRSCARASLHVSSPASPSALRLSGWWRACVRAINNVVDVTNYVMLEYGQPMHPYDAALLAAQAGGCNPPLLVIRRARKGEALQTLDGQTRLLTPEMLVIADGAGSPIGLAGIMGGATTEVSEATSTVALEVANWNPANIRRTSTRLGLRTEASTRFEKGLPAYLTALAADRAAALIAELAGGTVGRGLIDVGEVREERRTIVLPASEPRRLLGMDVDRTQIAQSLSPLGFAVQTSMPGAPDALAVTVPPWREDVTEAADLNEEIARMIGYDKVPE